MLIYITKHGTMNSKDRSYAAGYHYGIKGKQAPVGEANVMDNDWWAGWEDGHADLVRLREEGTLEEQLEASLE